MTFIHGFLFPLFIVALIALSLLYLFVIAIVPVVMLFKGMDLADSKYYFLTVPYTLICICILSGLIVWFCTENTIANKFAKTAFIPFKYTVESLEESYPFINDFFDSFTYVLSSDDS